MTCPGSCQRWGRDPGLHPQLLDLPWVCPSPWPLAPYQFPPLGASVPGGWRLRFLLVSRLSVQHIVGAHLMLADFLEAATSLPRAPLPLACRNLAWNTGASALVLLRCLSPRSVCRGPSLPPPCLALGLAQSRVWPGRSRRGSGRRWADVYPCQGCIRPAVSSQAHWSGISRAHVHTHTHAHAHTHTHAHAHTHTQGM